jgi:hypothetical protein
MIDEVQAVPPETPSRGAMLPKILLAVLVLYIGVSGYFLYSNSRDLASLHASQAELKQQLATARAEAKSSDAALAAQLGMTQKQLESRAAALRREQKEAAERLEAEEQQRLTAVTGEVSNVKSDVGAVRTDVAGAKADLESTKAKLERTIGDLGLQSGLIAKTRDELDILKHKGDRNYYEFTLARNAKKPVPVGTVSLQLKKTDPKKGKYTLAVLSDDQLIEKKDKNLNEPVQFYSGKDRYLFEVVVYKLDKDKVSGYLSTPKAAPQPVAMDKSGQ